MDAPAAPTPVAARRVLLVEDESVIRKALLRFFQRQGWAVDEAENGETALGLLLGAASVSYDVIVCDLRMPPGLSGEAVYDRLAAARPDLAARMVVSSGDVVSHEVTRFLARSGCAVLAKPYELAELRAVIARVTGVA